LLTSDSEVQHVLPEIIIMKTALTTLTLAAGVAFAGASANAELIDFTDNDAYGSSITLDGSGTQLSGTLGSTSEGPVTWTGTAVGGVINTAESGPGAQGPLDGENDGIGIDDDEITFAAESFTLKFSNSVEVSAIYLLDFFEPEKAELSINGGTPITQSSTVPLIDGVGFTAFEGLSFVGHTFTFTVGEPNEVGKPDYSLAGFEASVVPLPAGVLLLGGALGALGFASRRKKKADA
jgi:hypothetical protein